MISGRLNEPSGAQAISPDRISVRRLIDPSDEELNAAVQILLTAFKDDVGMASLSGGTLAIQGDLYERTIHACLGQGEVLVALVDGRISGVAASLAPGNDWQCYEDPEFIRKLSPSLKEWYSYHYITTYQKMYSSLGEGARTDGWNLKLLAVHPNRQRQGLGGLLLKTLCKQADAVGKQILTEVKSPYQVQWFRKSDFTHRSVVNLTSKDTPGFPLWCMVRDPHAGGKH